MLVESVNKSCGFSSNLNLQHNFLLQEICIKILEMENILRYIKEMSIPPQWSTGLRRWSTTDRLMGLRIRIPLGAFMSVSCECCVLSGRGLSNGPIPRSEESYRLWCVIVCDLETSSIRRPWPMLGCWARNEYIKELEELKMSAQDLRTSRDFTAGSNGRTIKISTAQ